MFATRCSKDYKRKKDQTQYTICQLAGFISRGQGQRTARTEMKQLSAVILALAICTLVVGSADVAKQGLYKGDSVAGDLYVVVVNVIHTCNNK